jgi:hypothetical protein
LQGVERMARRSDRADNLGFSHGIEWAGTEARAEQIVWGF